MFSKNWNLNDTAHAQKALVFVCGWGWNPASTETETQGNAHAQWVAGTGPQGISHVQQVAGPRSHSAAQTPPSPISGPQEFNGPFTGKGLTGNAAIRQAEKGLDRKRTRVNV